MVLNAQTEVEIPFDPKAFIKLGQLRKKQEEQGMFPQIVGVKKQHSNNSVNSTTSTLSSGTSGKVLSPKQLQKEIAAHQKRVEKAEATARAKQAYQDSLSLLKKDGALKNQSERVAAARKAAADRNRFGAQQ